MLSPREITIAERELRANPSSATALLRLLQLIGDRPDYAHQLFNHFIDVGGQPDTALLRHLATIFTETASAGHLCELVQRLLDSSSSNRKTMVNAVLWVLGDRGRSLDLWNFRHRLLGRVEHDVDGSNFLHFAAGLIRAGELDQTIEVAKIFLARNERTPSVTAAHQRLAELLRLHLPELVKNCEKGHTDRNQEPDYSEPWKLLVSITEFDSFNRAWFPGLAQSTMNAELFLAIGKLLLWRDDIFNLKKHYHNSLTSRQIPEPHLDAMMGQLLSGRHSIRGFTEIYEKCARTPTLASKYRHRMYELAVQDRVMGHQPDLAWALYLNARNAGLRLSWSICVRLLRALVAGGHPDRASELFCHNWMGEPLPEHRVTKEILAPLARMNVDIALRLYRRMKQEDYPITLDGQNKMVEALALRKMTPEAMVVRKDMLDRKRYLDAPSANRLMNALLERGEVAAAYGIYLDMRLHRQTPRPMPWSKLATALVRKKRITEGNGVFGDLCKEHAKVTSQNYSFFIVALAEAGETQKAYERYREVRSRGDWPDIKAITALVRVLGDEGKSEPLWYVARDLGLVTASPSEAKPALGLDAQAWNTWLLAAGRCQDYALLLRILSAIKASPLARTLERDQYFYNNGIDAYFRCGQWREGAGLFGQMIRCNVKPDGSTLAIIRRCRDPVALSDMASALGALDGTSLDGLRWQVLESLARCGQPNPAWSALEQTKPDPLPPDAFPSALAVLSIADGQDEGGFNRAGLIRRLLSGDKPDDETLIDLLQVLVSKGDAVAAWRAYSLLSDDGRRTPGIKGRVTDVIHADLEGNGEFCSLLRQTTDQDLVDFLTKVYATHHEPPPVLVDIALQRLASEDQTSLGTDRLFAKLLGRLAATAYVNGSCSGLSLDALVRGIHEALTRRSQRREQRHLISQFLINDSGAVRRLLTTRYVRSIHQLLAPFSQTSAAEARQRLTEGKPLQLLRRALSAHFPTDIVPECYGATDAIDLKPALSGLMLDIRDWLLRDSHSYAIAQPDLVPADGCTPQRLRVGSVLWRQIEGFVRRILVELPAGSFPEYWTFSGCLTETGFRLLVEVTARHPDYPGDERLRTAAENLARLLPPQVTTRVDGHSQLGGFALAVDLELPDIPAASRLDDYFTFLRGTAAQGEGPSGGAFYSRADRLFHEADKSPASADELRQWTVRRFDDLLSHQIADFTFESQAGAGRSQREALRGIMHELTKKVERTTRSLLNGNNVSDDQIQLLQAEVHKLYACVTTRIMLTRGHEEFIEPVLIASELTRLLRVANTTASTAFLRFVEGRDCSASCLVQPDLFRDALGELLHNAVKAVQVDGLQADCIVDVSVRLSDDGQSLLISITNPVLLTAAGAVANTGSGLGLAATQISAMGGQLLGPDQSLLATGMWKMEVRLPVAQVSSAEEGFDRLWDADDTIRNVWRVVRECRRKRDHKGMLRALEVALRESNDRHTRAALLIERASCQTGPLSRTSPPGSSVENLRVDLRTAMSLALAIRDFRLYQRALSVLINLELSPEAALELIDHEKQQNPEAMIAIRSSDLQKTVAQLAWDAGQWEEALALTRQWRQLLIQEGEPAARRVLWCEIELYKRLRAMGRFEEAIDACVSRLHRARDLYNRVAEREALNHLGTLYRDIRRPERAVEYFGRGAALPVQLGDASAMARLENGLAMALSELGRHAEAERLALQALKRARDHAISEATRRVDASHPPDERRRPPDQVAVCLCTLAEVLRNKGEYMRAAEKCEDATRLVNDARTSTIARARQALALAQASQREAALKAANEAKRLLAELREPRVLAEWGLVIGKAYAECGCHDQALRPLRAAVDSAQQLDHPWLLREAVAAYVRSLQAELQQEDAQMWESRLRDVVREVERRAQGISQ